MESNTVTQNTDTTLSEVSQHKEKVIKTPVFIIFAEYLGYVSRFNEIAIDWCDGKFPEPYVQEILGMEAKSIFRQMKKDYPLDQIQYWYDEYYSVILAEYEDKLARAIAALSSDED